MFSHVNRRKELNRGVVNNGVKKRGGLLEGRAGSQDRGNRELTIIRKYFVIFGSLTI